MALQIYNTLTRKKETFKPRNGKKVEMFVCGITTNNSAHLGHAKTFIQFDIIAKYLRAKGFNVKYIQNITDIEDKIIKRAKELGKTPKEVSKKYEKEYKEYAKQLLITSVNKYPKATEHIPEIISQIQRLQKKGFAYAIDDGIYFDLSKNKEYGKLSKRKAIQADDATTRIDDAINKTNKGDFCLWKFSKPNEPTWNAPFGKGRPGWHIEDTAITEKAFGPQYDIHGGAIDLIFPHHEAEIAQMESVSGKKPFVKYWMHAGFLNIQSKKMSKSLGNFMTIKGVLEKYDPKIIRYFFATAHYKSPVDFSTESLEQAKAALTRINDFIQNLTKKDNEKLITKTKKEFYKAMDDDFNTPKAFAIMFEFMNKTNKEGSGGTKTKALFKEIDKIFNVFTLSQPKIPQEIKKLAEQRVKARETKDFTKSDQLRKQIERAGFLIEDVGKTYRLKKK